MTPKSDMSTQRIAAIIPVFNERQTIADIVRRTAQYIERIIVVDDGSTDGSCETLEDLDVQIVRLPSNQGKGAALLRGIEAARQYGADYAVTLDADGQHPPECIPDLLRQASPDRIGIGSRVAGTQFIPTARLWANRTANFFISWAAGHWIEDTQCGFRIYPLGAFDRISLRPSRQSGFVFESEVLIEACRKGFRVTPVPIPALYDGVLQRPSHFRPVFDVSAIVIMVTGKLIVKAFYIPGLVRCQKECLERRRSQPCIRARDAAL